MVNVLQVFDFVDAFGRKNPSNAAYLYWTRACVCKLASSFIGLSCWH